MIRLIFILFIISLKSDYNIISTYYHDTSYYTQGFIIHDGFLYEGTGQYNKSKIIKYDLKTMRELQTVNISSSLFGEGIAILNDKLYQLTWKSKKVLVYDLKTLNKIDEMHNYLDGWGLTQNDESLFMSDGSNKIYEVDPKSFTELNSIEVFDDMGPVEEINELEYVDGYIYANIYQTEDIIKIDPRSGFVEERYSMHNLLKTKSNQRIDVLNGIAYNPEEKNFLITGKLWPKIFKITFN